MAAACVRACVRTATQLTMFECNILIRFVWRRNHAAYWSLIVGKSFARWNSSRTISDNEFHFKLAIALGSAQYALEVAFSEKMNL